MTPRVPVTVRRQRLVAARLTPLDWQVLETLRSVRVATGLQLQLLHHGEGEAAKQRRIRQLMRLSRMQVISRMDRRVIGGLGGGSVSSVYVLDIAGLKLLIPDGVARRPWQPSSPFVAHAAAVTAVLVDLTLAERRGELELVAFDAEPRCWRPYRTPLGAAVTLKPDADVVVATGEFEHHAFVEVDQSTESRPRLTAKAQGYVRYFATGLEQQRRGVTPQVVFLVPDERRRAVVIEALARVKAEHWKYFVVATAADTVAALSGQLTEPQP